MRGRADGEEIAFTVGELPPIKRKVARITERGEPRFIVRLPKSLNFVWARLYRERVPIFIEIKVEKRGKAIHH